MSRAVFLLALCAALAAASRAAAQVGTAMTYQGEVRSAGNPAPGPVDLRFRLYDALSGGNQIGIVQTFANVPLAAGRFTIPNLDFGAAYAAASRWVEIDVANPAGSPFATLSPRQLLTPAPFAVAAQNLGGQPASFFQNASNLSAGTIPDLRLSASVPLTGANQSFSGANTFTNPGNSFVGSGAGLTGINASNITAGTLADARLSSNVATLGGVQTFSGAKTFSSISNSFAGNGTALTINASNLVSGTVPSAQLSGTYSNALTLSNVANAFTGGGAGLTGLNASSIASGTLNDVHLSGNVALLSGLQNFSGLKTFSTAPSFTAGGSPFSVSNTTKVTSLNADLLDGLDAGAFAPVSHTHDAAFIVSGTLADARLSANVPRLSAGQTFAGANTFSATTTFNNTVDLNFGGRTLQFRNDGGLVPGLNLTGSSGNLGILRLRNALEIWPNDAATSAGSLDIRNTTGATTFSVSGDSGNASLAGSVTLDNAEQNDGTFSSGVVRLGSGGSGEGFASNRTSDTNGNRYGIDFYTGGGAKRMSITVDGRVGIGTAAPEGLLHVGAQNGGSSGDIVIPGPATASLPYTSTSDFPRQSFVAPFDAEITSIDITVSNNGGSRATFLGLTGPGVNAISSQLNLGSTTNPQVTTYTFNSPRPQIIGGQSYTWSWLGGPIDGLSRAWYRTDNPYPGGQGAGPGLPANCDFVCTIRTSAIATGTPAGLVVTVDRKTGINTSTPSHPLTVAGNARITGSLSKGSGSFQIDHPLDPENKYLFHSFVESPDMMNIYNGNAVTDGSGYATITLPAWFEALNRDFRYQLTVVDESDSPELVLWAKVVRKIQNNEFRVRSSRPNVEISWQVTGIRKDALAETNRIPIEVEKAGADKGRYLHPEAFGLPAQRGIYSAGSAGPAVAAPAASSPRISQKEER